MFRGNARALFTAAATAAAVASLSVTGAVAAGAATAPGEAAQAPHMPQLTTEWASHAAAIPGAQLWVRRYNGPGNSSDAAASVARSADGRRVFVTGTSDGGPATGLDYATVAYRASTGERLWAARYNGPSSGDDMANSVAVSPDGSKVFVTGRVRGLRLGEEDYATVAYRASTGARLWASVYRGPVQAGNVAYSVAASPDGSKVFVTGGSDGATSGVDYATIAYRASTGARLWVSRYNGPANDTDNSFAVAVNPAGSKVFVTGRSQGGVHSGYDYATVTYRASTGARLWVSRYNGPGRGDDVATSLVVSSAGSNVFVTGRSQGASSGEDYATVAYGTATGARLWASRYNGPGNGADSAFSAAVNPAGTKVYVTGSSDGRAATGTAYATVAYSAATGSRVWVSRYNGPGNGGDVATSVTVNPAGTKVYVTGGSDGRAATGTDYATVAYHG